MSVDIRNPASEQLFSTDTATAIVPAIILVPTCMAVDSDRIILIKIQGSSDQSWNHLLLSLQ